MVSELDQVLQDVGVAEVVVKLDTAAITNTGLALVQRGPVSAARAMRAMPDVMGLFISRKEAQRPFVADGPMALVSRNVPGAVARHVVQRTATPSAVVATLYPKLGLAVGLVDRRATDALSEHPAVQSITVAPIPRLIRPVAAAVAVPPRQATWGLSRMNVPQLWDRGVTGSGIVVGHLDTGVDDSHPALSGAVSAFAEFDLTGKMVPGAKASDSGVHGTHTAGTIAGRASRGKSIGVAPGATLASGMVIENGDVITRILSGMEWIVGLNVRILSMSLGISGYTPSFQVIIDALRNNNVLPVFAIGNEGAGNTRSPGNYATVLSVGALDAGDAVATFSGSGVFVRPDKPNVPDLVAPGVGVISCVPGGGYESMDGTSMATPHIAGLAALLLQAQPRATNVQLEDAITKSCMRPAGMTVGRGGAGVPDALRALTAILGGVSLPPLATSVEVARTRGNKGTATGRTKGRTGGKKKAKTHKKPSGRRKGRKED